MSAWIDVIGIGENGAEGLGPAAMALIENAEVLVGGKRHLAKFPNSRAECVEWGTSFADTIDGLTAHKGKRVVVLASGDPMFYGVGATLVRRLGSDAVTIHPAPGAVSLTCARMGWSIPETQICTIHGRPVENLNFHLAPDTDIVALSRDGDSAAKVAALLTAQGYGPSRITVLEHLGGADENRIEGRAESWDHPATADLNTLAIQCVAGPDAQPLSHLAGLPDDAYEHDGQITKREVRAVTLARLGPVPGEVLWDIGAGAGSVGIEWMRAGRGLRTVAFERDPDRAARVARNALKLGTTRLEVVTGQAPDCLDNDRPAPDAVFVGGGIAAPGMLEAAWHALKPGGRLVANAVTEASAESLRAFSQAHGGDITRIAISHFDADQGAFIDKRPITQLFARKERT